MQQIIDKYILDNSLFNNNDKLILAVSGGVDSMVLLHILYQLKYDIVIAHVNHNKRDESIIEQEYLINLAKQLNIPCEVDNYHHQGGNNFHDEAHHHRYKFFIEIAERYNSKIICTAHHQEDNLETIILNMLSGSNLYGYSGINNKLEINGYYITRPLMLLCKKQIYHYAKENNITYFEDSSNFLDDYRRNRIRHFIIPKLLEESPELFNKIDSYSLILRESFNFIRKHSMDYLNDNSQKINLTSFKELDIAVKKDVICLLFEKNNLEKSEKIIYEILNLIINNKPQGDITLKNEFLFKKRYNFAYIEKNNVHNKIDYIMYKDDTLYLDKYKLYFTKKIPLPNAKYIKLCYNSIAFPLFVRNRKDEDAIIMPYGRKKVKDMFIDLKIPKELRDKAILVCDNNKQILWIINYAKSLHVTSCKNTGDIYLVYEEYNHE